MTTQTIKQSLGLSAELAEQYAHNWQNASFEQLADAFHQVTTSGRRFKVFAFQLSLQDTLALVNAPQTEQISICMSLVNGKWTPMLQGRSKNEAVRHFENCYLPTVLAEPITMGANNYVPTTGYHSHQISDELVKLYIKQWQQTAPSQLIDAFHATVEKRQRSRELFYQEERVRYYHFSEEVTQELKAIQPDHITVFLGSGDAHSDHIFNFRPLLKVSKDEINAWFDFASPCPPFCGGGGGGGDSSLSV